MADLTGKTLLNRYQVKEFIGRGGMAVVYRVWDQQRSVHLAMKVLLDDLAEDRVFVRRFRREAHTLENLQHPHIVRFYGMEQDDLTVFMLMDFVDGTNLRAEIARQRGRPSASRRIQEVMEPVCSALSYAHNSGYVHCDVKPGNLLINSRGEVLVSDFGIARMTESSTMTMIGIGTPAYMAPELVQGKEPTLQSDIYAMGVILYEMLSGGERPFNGERARTTGSLSERVRWEQVNKPPLPLELFNPQLEPEVEKVVERCLQKEPAQRFGSAVEMYQALAIALNGVGKAASIPVQPVPGPVTELPTMEDKGCAVPLPVAPARDESRREPVSSDRQKATPLVHVEAAGMRGQESVVQARKPPRAILPLLLVGSLVFVVLALAVSGVIPLHTTTTQLPPPLTAQMPVMEMTNSTDVPIIVIAPSEPSFTPSIVPTATITTSPQPTATAAPVEINAANLSHLQPVTRLGLGVVRNLYWSSGGDVLYAITSLGVIAYDQYLNQRWVTEIRGAVGAGVYDSFHDTLALASGTQLNLVDAQNGEVKTTLDGPARPIRYLAYSLAGKYLAVASENELIIWETDSYAVVQKFAKDGIQGVWFSPDDNQVILSLTPVAPNFNQLFSLWDVTTGKMVMPVEDTVGAYRYTSSSLVFSASGKRFVSVNVDWGKNSQLVYLIVRDTLSGQHVCTLDYNYGLGGIVFSQDENGLYYSDQRGDLYKVGFPDGELQTILSVGRPFYEMAFHPDMEQIALADGARIQLWGLNSGQLAQTEPVFNLAPINATLSYDGSRLMLVGRTYRNWISNYNAVVWDFRQQQEVFNKPFEGDWSSPIALSPDGRTYAQKGIDGFIYLNNVEDDTETSKLAQQGYLTDLFFRPDGNILVGFTGTGSVRNLTAWNVSMQTMIYSLEQGLKIGYSNSRLDQDGRHLVAVGGEWGTTVKAWDLETGNPWAKYDYNDYISYADISPDLNWITAIAQNGKLLLWEVKTGRRVLEKSINASGPLVFTPDSQEIVIANGLNNGELVIYNLTTQSSYSLPNPHHGLTNDLFFTTDGLHLVTVGEDGTVWLWQIQP
jgi:serine/threonine protein kinase/WD40 repeat protein